MCTLKTNYNDKITTSSSLVVHSMLIAIKLIKNQTPWQYRPIIQITNSQTSSRRRQVRQTRRKLYCQSNFPFRYILYEKILFENFIFSKNFPSFFINNVKFTKFSEFEEIFDMAWWKFKIFNKTLSKAWFDEKFDIFRPTHINRSRKRSDNKKTRSRKVYTI